MNLSFLRKEVKEYVNQHVKPLYKTYDKAHNLNHFKFVTENCIEYAKELIKQGEKVMIDLDPTLSLNKDMKLVIIAHTSKLEKLK